MRWRLRCRLGGWLHDVGKVAIPDSIMSKPGPLDDAEWEVMRTHPVIGEEIVCGVEAVSECAAAVRHHHERYDGTGYPDRLAGTTIPIEARVVAAADAFCAMTSDRPYSARAHARRGGDGAGPRRRIAARPARGRGHARRARHRRAPHAPRGVNALRVPASPAHTGPSHWPAATATATIGPTAQRR